MNSLARSNASLYGNKEELYDRLRRHAYNGKKGMPKLIKHLFFIVFVDLDILLIDSHSFSLLLHIALFIAMNRLNTKFQNKFIFSIYLEKSKTSAAETTSESDDGRN